MLDSLVNLVWLVPLASFLAAALTWACGRWLGRMVWIPCLAASAFGALWSLLVLIRVASSAPAAVLVDVFSWLQVGELDVTVRLLVDPLSSLMLFMVTFVGSLIVLFSVWYMAEERGYARFFAEVALFLGAMSSLVLVANVLLLYVFWELVGLCSYLLIGFYFTRPSAAAAAKKAFVVNRVGDFGFAIGLLLLWTLTGTLHYDQLLGGDSPAINSLTPPWITLIGLLLFCGAVGKSAQFPLHVWLPDAMEGPTPVSALIHAATMVTAGVYMVARFFPLYQASALATGTVLAIGAFTAFLAAAIAVTQTDLKRILAYSTISQLAYMFMGLGTGQIVGAVAAIFHVFTHAFFKALLFLGSGSVMHATHGELNIWKMGGLRRFLPVTHWTFLCGALALAGIPLFSGFWSKDAILAAVWEAEHGGLLVRVALILGLVTAFLTAFYTARAYFLVFWGEPRDEEVAEQVRHYAEDGHPGEGQQHGPAEPLTMQVPLIALAAGAVLLGLILALGTGGLVPFLGHSFGYAEAGEHGHHPLLLVVLSSLLALAGFAAAYPMYATASELPARLAALFRPLYVASSQKFWIDEIWLYIAVRPMLAVAAACRVLDTLVVDGLVNLVASIPAVLARVFLRPMHSGALQFYAIGMLLGLAVIVILVVLRAS